MPALRLTAPFLIFLLIAPGETKIFSRCHLVTLLANSVPEDYAGYTINDWICLAHAASYYDSSRISKQELSSGRNYGLFQFNNMEHCSDGCRTSLNVCRADCIDFIDDDLTDDIQCVMKIIAADSGFGEWKVYNWNCKGKDLTRWTKGCSVPAPWDKW
nr:lysozyme C, milk isozyme-like [Anolis sagrei ordinatus]